MKKKRLSAILEIITERCVTTQEELCDLLQKRGFEVTQATVSRDIKELALTKKKDSSGIYRYQSPQVSDRKEPVYLNVFQSTCVSVDFAMNDVVIKCHTGMANAACAALDNMNLSGVVGTLAGDDTVLLITRNEFMAEQIANQIRRLIFQ